MISMLNSRHIGLDNNNYMNTKSSPNKSLIWIAIVVFVIFIAYFMFRNPTAPESSSLLSNTVSPQANAASTRILSLLNQIESLKIDTTFFKNPAYQSLVDFSVEIPELNVGRPNPFAPLPGSYVGTSTRR